MKGAGCVVPCTTPGHIGGVLAMAKCKPIPDAVIINISGSIMGEDMQKAMTGARGTPLASIAAISGITPHEQKGEIAPARDATTIVTPTFPELWN